MVVIEVLPFVGSNIQNKLLSKGNFDSVESIEKKMPESESSGIYEKSLDSANESDRLGRIDTPILSDTPNLYKRSSNGVSERFIKFIPSEAASWLQKNHPNAFLLLCLIAQRARRYNGHIDGLTIGMARLGDFRLAGIESESKYRTAKDVLVRVGAIKIVETARKRKKLTTERTSKTTTVGTLVLLLKSDIWDINPDIDDDRNDDRNDDRITTDSRPNDDEQERIKKEKEDKSSLYGPANAEPEEQKKKISSSKKRKKKEPEPLLVRDKEIFTSDTAHQKLIEARGGEQIVRQIYSSMAVWKAERGITGGDDYKTALGWNLTVPRQTRSHVKPQPKYNHDNSPRNPNNSISFAGDV